MQTYQGNSEWNSKHTNAPTSLWGIDVAEERDDCPWGFAPTRLQTHMGMSAVQ